jgi:MFS family permease
MSFLSNVRMFDSLRNSAFRFYFFAQLGGWAAMGMQMITNSLLIYRLTGSAAILGVMFLANAVPTLALSLFGGVLADRFQKKRLIQIAQAASAVAALGIAFALSTGYLSPEHSGSWWVIMAAGVFQGVFMALTMPANQAIIPELVPKEQVMNAVALSMMGMNVFQLAAPAVAGFLIDAISFEAVFYVMAALCVIAVIFAGFLPATSPSSIRGDSISGGKVLADVRGGLKYAWGSTPILLVLAFAIACMLLSMPQMMMLPIFTDDILKVGATGLGVLQSVSGAGALGASLAFASLPSKKRGIIMLVSGLGLGLGVVTFAFSRSWLLSLGMMIFIGIGKTGHMTLGTTLLQTLTDAEYLGRVMSILQMNMAISSFGTFFCGVLAEGIGAPWAVGGFAMGLALLSILALLFLPSIRKLD